jgi:thiopeptide-type bacteriocin biosynthesis protein
MKEMQRTYPPGSEWTYIKIYAGNKTVEKILVEDILIIISKIKRNHLIDKWFFIRYADPDFHLRIRFRLKDRQSTGQIIEIVNDRLSKLIKSGLVWKIQLDTYNRELERYGNKLIEEAESIFFADSECILSILKKLNNNEEYRWMIALKLIDNLLSDFSLDLEKKQTLLEQLCKSFKAEFRFNEYNAKQFNGKFRDNKQIIESILNNKMDEVDFIRLCESIKKRSKRLKPVIIQLTNKIESNNEEKQLESLLSSYIHMMMNRLFMTKSRIHELVLYDFMRRYYTSELVKQKYSKHQ